MFGHRKPLTIILVTLCCNAYLASSYDSEAYKDPHYADDRTTMVHLFEWKYRDIALECERFLGPAGFGGVQISPVTENIIVPGRPWYERYQPISFKLTTRSGDENDLKDMIERCNKVNVRIYVDAVINHMSADSAKPIGTGGSVADPSNLTYPDVPFGPDDFNKPTCSISNYDDPNEVRNCELVGLHDLNQSRENVRARIVELLDKVIDFGVAGFRIDAAKHMWPRDLQAIYSKMKNLREDVFGKDKRPFIYQEVISFTRSETINKWEYNDLGCVVEFVHSATLGLRFRSREKLALFQIWGFEEDNLLPSEDVVVMVDNHDNQRGHGAGGDSIITYKDGRLYKMATAFMLAHPYGQPRIMSSFDFNDPNTAPPMDQVKETLLSPNPIKSDFTNNVGNGTEACGNGWVCEHRWRQIYNMVKFRNVVGRADFANWWTNGDNQIAFSRGNRGFLAFNGQYNVDLKQNLQTGLPPGYYCDVISGGKVDKVCTGKTVKIEKDGVGYIEILKDEQDGVLAIHIEDKL